MIDQFIVALAERWPSAILLLLWTLVLRASRTSGWRMAIVLLPGTWLHEVMHFMVGWLLRAKPVSFSLWPKRNGNVWVLGYVGFKGLNIWNAAFVTMAPLLLFAGGALAFTHLLHPAFVDERYWLWVLLGYPIAACLQSGVPSVTDFRVGALSICMYASAAVGLWHLTQ